jgi:hypothetical protein
MVGAAVMLGVAAVSAQPEFIVPALLLAGAAAVTQRAAKQKYLTKSLAEMEKRLRVTEGELEATGVELEQLRVERQFDRQLLHALPTSRNS